MEITRLMLEQSGLPQVALDWFDKQKTTDLITLYNKVPWYLKSLVYNKLPNEMQKYLKK